MAGSTKYTKELVEDLCNHLANGETITYACEQVGIGSDTFKNWRKNKPEFRKKYKEAINTFRTLCPPRVKGAAKGRIAKLVLEGHIISQERSIVNEKPILSEDGNRIEGWTITSRQIIKTNTNMGTPQWVFDRILPTDDLGAAVKILQQYGLDVVIKDEDKFTQLLESYVSRKDGKSARKGLTDDEANEIRARILGVPANASDIVDVPVKMDY
jgi:hypothetical protein